MTTPFLSLNGITVPTAKGGQVSRTIYGEQTAGFDGSAQIDIRSRKRVWEFTTKPIDPVRAAALTGLILNDGYSIPFTQYIYNQYSTWGLAPSLFYATYMGNAADGAATYDENGVQYPLLYNRNSSIQIDRGTTNLLTAAQSQASSTAAFAVLSGTGVTLSVSTARYWESTTSLQVTPSTNFQVMTSGNATSGTAGQTFTASVYCYRTNSSGTPQINLYDNQHAQYVATANVSTSLNNWQRMVVTGTLSQNTTDLRIVVGGYIDTLWLDGWQLELQPSTPTNTTLTPPTAWVLGGTTRTSGNVSYPVTLNGSGVTASFWIANMRPTTAGSAQVLFNCVGNNTRFALEMDPLNTTSSIFNVVTPVNSAINYTFPSYAMTGWTHIVVSYNNNPPTGGAYTTAWVNGIVVGTDNATQFSPGFSTLQIGQAYGGFNFTGRIADFQILPFPVEQTWVTGTFYAAYGAPWNPPFINASGFAIDGNASQSGGGVVTGYSGAFIPVYGEMIKETYTGFQHPVFGWVSQGRTLNFRLTEV